MLGLLCPQLLLEETSLLQVCSQRGVPCTANGRAVQFVLCSMLCLWQARVELRLWGRPSRAHLSPCSLLKWISADLRVAEFDFPQFSSVWCFILQSAVPQEMSCIFSAGLCTAPGQLLGDLSTDHRYQ